MTQTMAGEFAPARLSHPTDRDRLDAAARRWGLADVGHLRPGSDELREIRARWFAERGIEVVVDVYDGSVVTMWRTGGKS